MLPIEKGCLAMIINSKAGNDGKVVTVGNYLGMVPPRKDGLYFKHTDRWEINIDIKTEGGGTHRHASEKHLMRIDGHKEETKQKAEVVR